MNKARSKPNNERHLATESLRRNCTAGFNKRLNLIVKT
jgi:hypothetical protein